MGFKFMAVLAASALLITGMAFAQAQETTDGALWLEGEVEVIAGEDSQMYVLQTADGAVLDLALNQSWPSVSSLYSGLRIKVLSGASKDSSAPSHSPSRHRQLLRGLDSSAVPVRKLMSSGSQPELPASPGLIDVDQLVILSDLPWTAPETAALNTNKSVIVPRRLQSNGGAAATPLTGPVNQTSVAWILSFCGMPAAITVDAFRALWHGPSTSPDPAPPVYSMPQYYANCSHGAVQFRPESNLLIPQVIEVPCTGFLRSGQAYNLSLPAFGSPEIYGLMEAAENISTQRLGVHIPSSTRRRVAILPALPSSFKWSGLGSVGCAGSRCHTWINGKGASNLPLIFHELGHNAGSMHSMRQGSTSEYGDSSCAMGSGATCLNAPQMWRLGWATTIPEGAVSVSSLPGGRWTGFTLPAQHFSNANMLRIIPDVGPAAPAGAVLTPHFVSYRFRAAPFENLITALTGRVMLHAYNNTRVGAITDARTLLKAALATGSVLAVDVYGVKRFALRVGVTTATAASVSLCRPTAVSEIGAACRDGLDNDCDGVADELDSSCGPLAGEHAPVAELPAKSPPPSPTRVASPTPTRSPPPPSRTNPPPPTPARTPKPTPSPTPNPPSPPSPKPRSPPASSASQTSKPAVTTAPVPAATGKATAAPVVTAKSPSPRPTTSVRRPPPRKRKQRPARKVKRRIAV